MGNEAVCRVRYGREASEGKALLETNELIFRGGDFRLRVPFAEMTKLVDADGELRFVYNGKPAVFELGRDAAKWAAKIRNPRGLLDKLGVKEGARVAVLGVADGSFMQQLDTRATVTTAAKGKDYDFVFYEADAPGDLKALKKMRGLIKPAGAIWVVSPKGKGAQIKDVQVMAAAREAGLVDNKVAAFSATHTALKLVIPVALRK